MIQVKSIIVLTFKEKVIDSAKIAKKQRLIRAERTPSVVPLWICILQGVSIHTIENPLSNMYFIILFYNTQNVQNLIPQFRFHSTQNVRRNQ